MNIIDDFICNDNWRMIRDEMWILYKQEVLPVHIGALCVLCVLGVVWIAWVLDTEDNETMGIKL